MDKCVVRQAIKEQKTDSIVGYELLIQSDEDSLYNPSSDSIAANAITAFLSENSTRIFHERCTFMTFTPSLLFRNTPKLFDKDKIVIQIEDNIVIHPLASILIGRYRSEGYRFAINDFQFTPKYFSMLEFADYIKIDISDKVSEENRRSLENIVEMAHGFQKEFIATGVNSRQIYDYAKELKVDYVEGNYISDAMITKTSKLEYMQGNLYQLIVEVTKDEPDTEKLEEIISRDVALTYAILKMANSAYFAVRHQTASIRQAIVRVGISQIKQWVYLLSFKEGENASEEMLRTSFLRANFASALVKKMKGFPITSSDAYLLGMFSTLEYMVDATLEEILADIPIADEVKQALISQEGEAGKLYKLILCYERAEWNEIKPLAEELGLQINVMAQLYIECVEDVREIWDTIVGAEGPTEETIQKAIGDAEEKAEA